MSSNMELFHQQNFLNEEIDLNINLTLDNFLSNNNKGK